MLIKATPLRNICLKWIKGHQKFNNDSCEDQALILLNERCDELAAKGHKLTTVPKHPFFKSGKIALYHKGEHVQNLWQCLIEYTEINQMNDYLLEKKIEAKQC